MEQESFHYKIDQSDKHNDICTQQLPAIAEAIGRCIVETDLELKARNLFSQPNPKCGANIHSSLGTSRLCTKSQTVSRMITILHNSKLPDQAGLYGFKKSIKLVKSFKLQPIVCRTCRLGNIFHQIIQRR